MNAVVESERPAASALRRIYAGEGYPAAAPAETTPYVALVPSDDEMSREELLRVMVSDALQRNGKVVDEDTLDATVASAQEHFAPDAFVWKLQAGETRQGPHAPPFHGYAVEIPAPLQQSLLSQAGEWSAQRDSAPPPPLDASIAGLRSLALGENANDVARTLDAIEAAIRAGQAASAEGQPVDAVALRSVLEFATRMGKEREAAKILERYTALKGVAEDAKLIGRDAERVFNGRDPVTGKPLNSDQRVEAAFGLIGNGFKMVGDLGAAAQLLGVGGSLARTLIGIAPAGIAIVGFAAGVYGLVKKIREAIKEPEWDEFRLRFPDAEGLEPKQFLKAAMRQIEGMPVEGGNGASTANRILELFGNNPDTRERYLAFLRGKVEPDTLVDALAAGRFEGMSAEQATLLGRASKGYAREFLSLEIDDTKRYIKDRDGDRTRGTYLLEGEYRAQAERNTNKVGGAVDEALRVGSVLIGGGREFDAMLRDMLGKVRGSGTAGQSLGDAQATNVAGAAVAAASAAGLSRIDHVLASKDGARLFAVQGDPQSDTRRMVAIDVTTASALDAEASRRQFAQLVPPPTPDPQVQQVAVR